MCFDKTGTLTKGELTITDFHLPDKSSIAKTFALQVARDLEVPSHHPLGKAVKSFVTSYDGKSLTANKIPQVETVPGKGLRGQIIYDEGDDIWNEYKPTQAILGNEKLMEENDIEFTEKERQWLKKWKENVNQLF